MLKNFAKSILDPKSEKALHKALEELDLKLPDQRQALASLIIENQNEIGESESIDQINDIRLLVELIPEIENEALESALRKNLSSAVLDTSNFQNLHETSEALITLGDKNAIFLLLEYIEVTELVEKALATLENTQKYKLIDTTRSQLVRDTILNEIQNLEELKGLEKTFLNKNKNISHSIQERIKKIEAHEKIKHSYSEQVNKLIDSVHELEKSAFFPLYESKYQHLASSYQNLIQELNKQTNIDIDSLFTKAQRQLLEASFKNIESIVEENRKQEKTEEEKQNARAFLETSIDKFKTMFSEDTLDINKIEEEIKRTRNALTTLKEDIASFDLKLFEAYCEAIAFEKDFSSKTDELNTLDEEIDALGTLFDSNHKRKKALDETLNKISSAKTQLNNLKPANESIITPTLGLLNEKLNRLSQFEKESLQLQKEFKAKFDKKTGYIKNEIENKDVNTVYRLCKESEELIQYCPQKQRGSLQKRLNEYNKQFKELEDWYNFATLPKRKELLQKMQALAKEAPRKKIKVLKDEIKALQNDWKSLGHARDKEGKAIWADFQKFGDDAYQPVKQLIDRKEEEKNKNLQTRIDLLEQLTAHLNQLDTDTKSHNWNDSETLLKNLEKSWKRAFPVPAKNKELETEYLSKKQELEKKLQPQRKVNLGKKTILLQQAEKLVKLEDNKQAIEEAKRLQQEWKLLGYTENDNELWNSFKEHCDKVFQQRDEIRDQYKAEEDKAIKEALACCLAIENIDKTEANDFEQELNRLSGQFEEIKALPKKRKDIFNQYKQARKSANKKLSRIKKQQESQIFEQIENFYTAIAELEHKIANTSQPQDELKAELNSQLEQFDFDKPLLNQIKQSFDDLVNASDISAKLQSRKDALKKALISLEIDLEIDTPEEDKSLRMQMQVERLNKKFNKADQQASFAEQLISCYFLGGIFSYQDESIAKRLKQLQQRI